MGRDDLPRIGAPASRALAIIGITRLDQVAEKSESELLPSTGLALVPPEYSAKHSRRAA